MKSIRERNYPAARGRGVFVLALGVFLCALPGRISTAAQPAPCTPAIKTDRAIYAEPPLLPALPPAGGKFCDPVFGAEIMRVTDQVDYSAPGCGTFYNQWPTFNSDNTKLLIRCGTDGDVLIRNFNPVTFTLGTTLRTSPAYNGVRMNWQSAHWSATDPDIIYVSPNGYDADYPNETGPKIFTYHPLTNTWDTIPLKDFTATLGNHYFFEVHANSDDNDVWTLSEFTPGAESNPTHYVFWRRSTDTILARRAVGPGFNMNNCNPDKTGAYIYCGPNVWNDDRIITKTADMTEQTLSWNHSDDPPAHGDLGSATAAGRGAFSGWTTIRSLANVHTGIVQLFDWKDTGGTTDLSNDAHTSLYADNEDWMLLGVYDDPDAADNPETGAFENEVMQVATSSPQRIRRLFHHYSHVTNVDAATNGYWANPKPTITKDGRYVAFTSNWGNSGRTDLFIAKIEPAPVLTPQPPTELAATAVAAPGLQVSLTWTAPPGAVLHYEVKRKQSINQQYQSISQPTTASYTDAGVSPGTAYLYCVSAVYTSGESPCSDVALATTVIFSDDPLNVLAPTTIKAQHVTELRQAVNAVRAAAEIGPADWTLSPPAQQFALIYAQHFLELRTNLNPALSALDLPLMPVDPTLGAGQPVRAAHVQDVRLHVR